VRPLGARARGLDAERAYLDRRRVALVTIADNGAGSDKVTELGDAARQIAASWGASVDAASEPGQGCAFELRLVTTPP